MSRAYLRLENEDGSFREYKKDRIKARWVKEGMKHSKKIADMERKNDMVGLLEERLRFTCDFFGDKDLTPDSILDGLDSEELTPTLDKIFSAVMGKSEEDDHAVGKQ